MVGDIFMHNQGIIGRVLSALRRAYDDQGWAGIPAWVWYHSYERCRSACERSIETGARGDEKNNGDYVRYQPMPYSYIKTVLKALGVTRGQRAVLDYGCGKGRVLIEAAKYPCVCVHGVDYNAELAGIAQKNVEASRYRFASAEVKVFCADARAFPVDDRIDTIILNNPFTADILAEALARVVDSRRRNPRAIVLGYVSSAEEPCLTRLLPALRITGGPRKLGVASGMFLRLYQLDEH